METSDNSDTVQTVHLIQHMHSVHGGRFVIIPLKRTFLEWIKFVEGSSGTRAVVELVVLVAVVEVVVHGRRGSSCLRRR